MKKCIICICLAFCILFSLSGCGKSAKAQEAYDAIGSMSFSDESILTAEESQRLSEMREARETALQDKDIDDLEALKNEWDAFRSPIDSFISQYETIKKSYFTDSEKSMLTSSELEECTALEKQVKAAYESRNETELQSSGAAWEAYCKPLREVFDAYKDIEPASFSETDLSLMAGEDREELQQLTTRTEDALNSRNTSELRALNGEWSSFTARASANIEQAKEKLLNDFVAGANFTSSLANLFSFGTMTSSTAVDGHRITITTQYNTDMVSDDGIKSEMDSYLSMMSSTLQSGVDSLKAYIDDVCIRVEYKNRDGKVISFKEFS